MSLFLSQSRNKIFSYFTRKNILRLFKRNDIFIIILLNITILSCKDDLDPFGETNDKYVLNCIIRSDTSYQTLTLTKSYSALNYDPYSNTSDPAIKGAVIRLWEGNLKVTFFTDTTITRDASSLYKTPYTIYHARGLQPGQNSVLNIEAILPDGTMLTAAATTPVTPGFLKLGDGGQGDTILPPVDKDYIMAQWRSTSAGKEDLFLPKVYIVYKVPENGTEVRKIKLIPESYFTYKGTEYPKYPIVSNVPWVKIDMAVINRCMAEIAGDDTDKEKYKIYSIRVDVLSLDKDMSAYYNAGNKNKDPYSIKVSETDYTNINGGLGIFGVTCFCSTVIDITGAYVRSFGYVHGYKKD